MAGQLPPTANVVIQRYDPKQDTAVSGSHHTFTKKLPSHVDGKTLKILHCKADTGIIQTTSTLYTPFTLFFR